MRITIATVGLLLLVACDRENPASTPETAKPTVAVETTAAAEAPASLDPLPAHFSGVLPCADCAGIRFDIDLRPSNLYFLRMTYMGGPDRSYDDIGSWSIASDLRTLALKGARQSPLLFAINDASTLRKLNNEGQVIESELNYTVKRAPTYEPLAPQVPLRGMYAPDEGVAMFEECTTGVRFPLEGPGAEEVAQQFAALRKGKPHPVLLALEGTIESRAAVGGALREALVIATAAKFWPGESCGARGVTHDLEDSRWVLVRIGDTAFVPREGKAEPYIALQAATKQFVGHAGCNRMNGSYAIEGNRLRLSDIATTRMACPEMDTENALLNALDAVTQWKLTDNQLVLLGKDGTALVQLESRNL